MVGPGSDSGFRLWGASVRPPGQTLQASKSAFEGVGFCGHSVVSNLVGVWHPIPEKKTDMFGLCEV